MRKTKFSKEVLLGVPREEAAGRTVCEIARTHRITAQIYYR
jgi:hypothetical protein